MGKTWLKAILHLATVALEESFVLVADPALAPAAQKLIDDITALLSQIAGPKSLGAPPSN
jgi:hypothetical protein